MVNVFNVTPVAEIKKHMRLTTKQVAALTKHQNKINRFIDISKIDGIGIDTYKALFKLFYSSKPIVNEQLSLL